MPCISFWVHRLFRIQIYYNLIWVACAQSPSTWHPSSHLLLGSHGRSMPSTNWSACLPCWIAASMRSHHLLATRTWAFVSSLHLTSRSSPCDYWWHCRICSAYLWMFPALWSALIFSFGRWIMRGHALNWCHQYLSPDPYRRGFDDRRMKRSNSGAGCSRSDLEGYLTACYFSLKQSRRCFWRQRRCFDHHPFSWSWVTSFSGLPELMRGPSQTILSSPRGRSASA